MLWLLYGRSLLLKSKTPGTRVFSGSSCGWRNTHVWYLKWKRCQPDIEKDVNRFFWYMCPLNQPSDMFINVLLQDVRHPKVRYTPKLNIESFFHGVWKRTAILVIATNICVTSMPYCWLYIPSDFSSIERINPYFWYWYIYIFMYIYIWYIYIYIYMIYIYT